MCLCTLHRLVSGWAADPVQSSRQLASRRTEFLNPNKATPVCKKLQLPFHRKITYLYSFLNKELQVAKAFRVGIRIYIEHQSIPPQGFCGQVTRCLEMSKGERFIRLPQVSYSVQCYCSDYTDFSFAASEQSPAGPLRLVHNTQVVRKGLG